MLPFDGRYAGIFVASGPVEALSDVEVPLGLDIATYRSPALAISVLVGSEHPEPVLQWLQGAHETCRGSSFLAEILRTGGTTPAEPHCHLIRVPYADLDDGLAELLVQHSVLCARLPLSGELVILCPAEIGMQLCTDRAHLKSRADFGLALVGATSTPPPKGAPVGTPRAYDPVGARASELLHRTKITFDDHFREVRRLLREPLGLDPPAELTDVEREVDRLFRAARGHLANLEANLGDEDVAATSLDIAGRVGADYTKRLARLADQLRIHAETPDPWSHRMAYMRASEPQTLLAIRALVHEVSGRLVPAEPARVLVPVLGDDFSVQFGIVGALEWVVASPGPMGMLVSYPRRLGLRAGALPVLASSVAWATCDLAEVGSQLVTGGLGDAGEELGVRLAEETIPTDADRRAAISRAEIMLADLVAAAVAGPAYVFALARFAPGSMGPSTSRLPTERVPALEERILVCLRLLRKMRINVPFASRYMTYEGARCGKELAETIMALVVDPFDGRRARLRPVIRALRRGEIVDEPPTLLLNALWDSVVRRSGYLNEIALFESLVSQSP
jgi:hypothetical protein